MDRRTFLRFAGATAIPAVAGCASGDGDSTGKRTDTPTGTGTMDSPTSTETTPPETEMATESVTETTPTATQEPQTAQEKYPNYDWSQLEGVEPTQTTTIRMSGYAFKPLVASVQPGASVTVENEDSANHTFTAPMLDVHKVVDARGSTTFTVEQTGEFDYVCEYHADMLGRLVVTENL